MATTSVTFSPDIEKVTVESQVGIYNHITIRTGDVTVSFTFRKDDVNSMIEILNKMKAEVAKITDDNTGN